MIEDTTHIDFKNSPEILSRFRQVVDSLGRRSDCAKLAGVTEDAIRKYMNGKAVPSIDVVSRLCLNAKISIDWLMTGSIQSVIKDSNDIDFSGLSLIPVREFDIEDFAYFSLSNNKTALGTIENIKTSSYEISPLTKTGTITIKKSDIEFQAKAQLIKYLD